MAGISKAHIQYRNKDGEVVPGVTTVIGILEKGALLHWVAKITKEGHDWTKYRDDKGSIGSLVHRMILDYLRGETTDTSDYSKNQIDTAENSFHKYLEWAKNKKIEPVAIEQPLVSEIDKYGGTPDFVGYIDGEFTILDYKTGNAIYEETSYQLAAYDQLVMENGLQPMETLFPVWRVLNIPRDNSEDFIDSPITNPHKRELCWQMFMALLSAYRIRKEIKGGKW